MHLEASVSLNIIKAQFITKVTVCAAVRLDMIEDVVELPGLVEPEPLSGAVCAGEIGIGVPGLDAELGVAMGRHTGWGYQSQAMR